MNETDGVVRVQFPAAPGGLTTVEIATVMTSMNNMYEVLRSWADPKYADEAIPESLGNRRRSYLYKPDRLQVNSLRYGSPLELVYGLDGSQIIMGATIATTAAVAIKACFSGISSAFKAASSAAHAAEDTATAIRVCLEEFQKIRRLFRGDHDDNDGNGTQPPLSFGMSKSINRPTSIGRSVEISPVEFPDVPPNHPKGIGLSLEVDAAPTYSYQDADVERLMSLIIRECQRILGICGRPRFDF